MDRLTVLPVRLHSQNLTTFSANPFDESPPVHHAQLDHDMPRPSERMDEIFPQLVTPTFRSIFVKNEVDDRKKS
jgi:hypothetical protein